MEVVLAIFGLVVAIWMIRSAARRHRGDAPPEEQDKR
jgi:hypothetical protein